MARNLENSTCPKCYRGYLKAIGERTGGFSGGKAVVGAALIGPLGLAAGAFGKRKTTYQCNYCNYTVER